MPLPLPRITLPKHTADWWEPAGCLESPLSLRFPSLLPSFHPPIPPSASLYLRPSQWGKREVNRWRGLEEISGSTLAWALEGFHAPKGHFCHLMWSILTWKKSTYMSSSALCRFSHEQDCSSSWTKRLDFYTVKPNSEMKWDNFTQILRKVHCSL